MTLILLAILLTVILCVIAWYLAIYALPVMTGITAFQYVYGTDAGFLMSAAATFGVALVSVVPVIAVLGFAKNTAFRLVALSIFAVPAAIAGFALVHGVTKHMIDSTIGLSTLGGFGALVIGGRCGQSARAGDMGLVALKRGFAWLSPAGHLLPRRTGRRLPHAFDHPVVPAFHRLREGPTLSEDRRRGGDQRVPPVHPLACRAQPRTPSFFASMMVDRTFAIARINPVPFAILITHRALPSGREPCLPCRGSDRARRA